MRSESSITRSACRALRSERKRTGVFQAYRTGRCACYKTWGWYRTVAVRRSRGCERVCSNAARDIGAYSLIVGKGQDSPGNGPDRRGFEGVRDVAMRPSQHIPAPTFPRWPLCLHPRNLFEFVGPTFAGGLACGRSAEHLGFYARHAMCSLANTSISNASML